MNNDGEYTLKDTMSHDEIVEFIKPWLKKKNVYTVIYNIITIGGVAGLAAYFGYAFVLEGFQMEVIGDFFLGGAFAFVVIPLHEWLHGVAYKMVGAPKVEYHAHWKKMVFYAAADGYEAGFREFRIVALMPFIVMTLLGLILMVASGFSWVDYTTGFIFFHAAFCGGDFGLLSYMHEHKNEGIITVDDMANKETRFMVRASETI